MSIIVTEEPPNIWEEVCKEFQKLDPTIEHKTKSKEDPTVIQFSSKFVHPAVHGRRFTHNEIDGNALTDFNANSCHPAFAGSFCFVMLIVFIALKRTS